MLADLRGEEVKLPPELDNAQLETKLEDNVTVLDAASPPQGKVAENISAPFPGQEQMAAVDAEDSPVTGMEAISKAQAMLDDPPELAAEEEEGEERRLTLMIGWWVRGSLGGGAILVVDSY